MVYTHSEKVNRKEGNPYCFMVGSTVVKLRFKNDGTSCKEAMNSFKNIENPTIEDIISADKEVREQLIGR